MLAAKAFTGKTENHYSNDSRISPTKQAISLAQKNNEQTSNWLKNVGGQMLRPKYSSDHTST